MIVNQVTGPYRLERVSVSIDDGPKHTVVGLDQADRNQPLHLLSQQLRPGRHYVTAYAKAAASGREVLHLQSTRWFHCHKGPAAVLVMIGPQHRGDSPTIELTLRGSAWEEPPQPQVQARRCEAGSSVQRMMCRTERALAVALQQRDFPKALCIQEKLAKMRAVSDTMGQLEQASSRPAISDEPAVAQSASLRVQELARSASACGSTLEQP